MAHPRASAAPRPRAPTDSQRTGRWGNSPNSNRSRLRRWRHSMRTAQHRPAGPRTRRHRCRCSRRSRPPGSRCTPVPSQRTPLRRQGACIGTCPPPRLPRSGPRRHRCPRGNRPGRIDAGASGRRRTRSQRTRGSPAPSESGISLRMSSFAVCALPLISSNEPQDDLPAGRMSKLPIVAGTCPGRPARSTF
jgi:hypothetical protein